jgi:hypothetical protein
LAKPLERIADNLAHNKAVMPVDLDVQRVTFVDAQLAA